MSVAKVSYDFFDRMLIHKLGFNTRGRQSVCWALRYKFGDEAAPWYVGDLLKLTRHELAIVPGCGPKTLKHVEDKLAEVGLSFAKESP